jgi:hypothetical protein
MRVVKYPFQEVDLGIQRTYLELNSTSLALLRLGWDPKRVIRLYIWGFEEVE